MNAPENAERRPLLRVPSVTLGIIAALVAAYIARAAAPALTSQALVLNYSLFPARYSHKFLVAHNASPQSFWELAVPFVSYVFLHTGVAHLAIICAILLPFGTVVARRIGTAPFLGLFFASAIAGAAIHLATHWGSTDYMIGASVAACGVLAAGLRIIVDIGAPDLRSYVAAVSGAPGTRQPLAPFGSAKLLGWSAVFVVVNIIASALGSGAGHGLDLVAWQAHLAGYLAGLLLIGPLDRLASGNLVGAA